MNHGLKVNNNVLEITLPDGIDIEKVVVNGKVFLSPQQADEFQERQSAAQKRRYTFGNDEFSLEAAYHDCKLVFDGITDDESFQGADTGLILYYANEIIYALQEALEVKDTNAPSNDTIDRQAAIDECNKRGAEHIGYAIAHLPSAQPDTSRIENILHGKSPEEQYDFLWWLMQSYGMQFSDTRIAVIEWLRGERNG